MMIGFTMSLIIFILGTYSIKLQKIIVKQIQTNSELEEAKLRAEESSKQKSLFLANMSHELRTPLNAIIGFSEIIKSESLGPIEIVQYKEYGNDINSSGTHLLSIINDILDFSKAESDKLQIDNIQLDLTKLIKQTMRIIADRAERAGVSVVDQTGEEHVIINGDPKRLKQVILNILSNAIKFTSEEGEIILRIVAQKEKVLLEIKDSGIGIESKDIAKVMSPFEQVDSQHSRRHDGTGLGLPLSKKLVELMKGTFQIESEIGIGTTVKLYFNIAA
jgi:two-component system cell cycle sensor histidine kinase PleC